MNASKPADYRTAMEQAALAFIRRHHAQHLSHDQVLFSRTVSYLRHDYGVEAELACLLVGRAYGAFRSADERRYLDVANSSETVAVLTDPANGLTHLVPVATLFRLLIDAPERRHLTAVC